MMVIAIHPFIKELYLELKKSNISDLAAHLAYYFLLSLFPLIIFLLTLLPYFHLDAKEIVLFIQDYAPGDTGDFLKKQIMLLFNQPNESLLSVSVIATLWTASAGTGAIIRSINAAYGVGETRPFWIIKLYALLLTLGIVVVVVITLLLPVFGKIILDHIQRFIFLPHNLTFVLNLLRWIVGLAVMFFVIMFLFYIAPNQHFSWVEVIWGALFTTLSWQLISLAFSFYVSNFGHYSTTYGSLGAIIVLLIWFYLSGLVIILGGIINAVLYNLNNNTDSIQWKAFFQK